jgi:hypothetical protein
MRTCYIPLIALTVCAACNQKQPKTSPAPSTAQVTKEQKQDSTATNALAPTPDTVPCSDPSGRTLYIVIYEHHSDMPGKPLKRFKIVDESNNVIFTAKTDTLDYSYEPPNEDMRYVLIKPLYYIESTNPIKIKLSFYIDEHTQFDSNKSFYFPEFFDAIGSTYNFKNKIFDFILYYIDDSNDIKYQEIFESAKTWYSDKEFDSLSNQLSTNTQSISLATMEYMSKDCFIRIVDNKKKSESLKAFKVLNDLYSQDISIGYYHIFTRYFLLFIN